ncbi:MlaD family protein [Nocardia sp. NPDC004860]|uniref:MlaD family protein n=1 Tax=Nocardia sp. NPDC004860 TaxID=3154557 RepID=UPI0033B591EB
MRYITGWKMRLGSAALGCGLLAVSGCSVGPDDLPSMRGGVGAGYEVVLQFASAMNLPTGADVMMDGLRVGEVSALSVHDSSVTVTAHLKGGTNVPTSVRAVIRQNTLLGDTYIALDHGEITGGPYLQPGGSVPVAQTSSPPQLEDTMAVLALFINGGSIQRIENTMGGLNSVMPQPADVQRLASVVATDLGDLAGDTSKVDRLLDGFNATAVSVDSRSQSLSEMFSQPAEHYWRRVAVNIVSYISQILPSVGSVYEGGMWMVPMLNSLADDGAMIRSLWDSGPSTADKLSDFLRSTVVPFAQNPSVDIRSIQGPQGDQIVSDVENVLRMLGAVK